MTPKSAQGVRTTRKSASAGLLRPRLHPCHLAMAPEPRHARYLDRRRA